MGGGCYATFDGSSGYISVPSAGALNLGTGDFSISFWINTTDTSFSVIDKTLSTNSIQLIGRSGKLDIYISSSGGNAWNYTCPITSINIGSFVHIVVVKNSSGIKFYLNGSDAVVTTQVIKTGTVNLGNTSDLIIGKNSGSFFSGSLDDLRIYKGIAATPAQVANIVASNGVYDESQAGAASFVMNFDTDFDGDGKIYDQIGNLAGTKNGGVTIEQYPPSEPSPIWSVGPSQTGLIQVPHGISTLYYQATGITFLRKLVA